MVQSKFPFDVYFYFRHLHSNLYLGEEFCLKTTYSNLKPLVTKFHLYIDA